MVQWYWLLVSFFAGSFVGILMTVMMMAIEKGDDNEHRGLR
jgi:hypothetical protein